MRRERGGGLTRPVALVLACVILLAATAGCLNTARNLAQGPADAAPDSTPAPMEPAPGPANSTPPAEAPPAVPVVKMTPHRSNITSEAVPILPEDPYVMQHGTRINQTGVFNRAILLAEFEKTYVFRGNATAFHVNVVEGPLIIEYEVTPQVDCLGSLESCRGSNAKPVQRPYFTMTVRDNATHQVIAENGYGREYSSQTINWITIYREGEYHVTMTGNYLDVFVQVGTGQAANSWDAQWQAGSGSPTADPTPPPEEAWG